MDLKPILPPLARIFDQALAGGGAKGINFQAGTYTRPPFSSTYAVLVTLPGVPLSNRLGVSHAPDVSHKMCLR